MNIVNTLAKAGLDFVVINVVALPFVIVNAWTVVWYALCIGLAFALRIAMEHKQHRLTWSSLLYQAVCTVSYCFAMVLVWNYLYEDKTKGFEIYLFVNSFFASFMVGQLESVGKVTIKEWLRSKLSTFLATPTPKTPAVNEVATTEGEKP